MTDTQTPTSLDLADERLIMHSGVRGWLSVTWNRIRSGDVGSLPVIIGLVIICVVFQALNPFFLSSANLTNLLLESAAVGTIAIGIVLVLLVAQIDLSVGSMSGLASAILGVGLTQHGWSVPVAMAVALIAGIAVGALYGFIFVKFSVPSFVITLAGLLALLGLQLRILGTNGSINIPFESGIVKFTQATFLPPVASYVLAAVAVAGWVASRFARARRRAAAHLSTGSMTGTLITAAGLLVAAEAALWYLNDTRGVGASFVLFLALVVIFDFLLQRTRWGRSVYAVGGSVEAARRAGLKVTAVYMSVFIACSALAALGGLLAAGRLATASISSGTGDTNLNAIAAAVIGGTSLFGGRGNVWSALLGILTISAISSGLTLLSLSSDIRFIITGGVLMLAVIVDSIARRSREAHGRA
ncbi:sugar ABC transporter permease [Nocardioides astragali]|uniref:Xylose transport system permease protein XylH n=1 Tax=Nocardioides astragali TaxID=1776736 RepID=A0ABW2N950_9ACTN|nr:sugar ABC transporter permease [Nocardioides astragali]